MAPSRLQNPYEERQNAVLGRILVNVVSPAFRATASCTTTAADISDARLGQNERSSAGAHQVVRCKYSIPVHPTDPERFADHLASASSS